MNDFRSVALTRTDNFRRAALSNEALLAKVPSVFADDKHGSRSERYTYIPTIRVLDALRDSGFVVVDAKQGRSRIEGKAAFTKHLVRLQFRKDEPAAYEIGGLIPEVVLVNSHDGTSTYQLKAGMLRIACLNGLIVADTEFGSMKVTHTGQVAQEVIEGSFTVIEEARRAIGQADQWSQITLSQPEQQAFAESARVLRLGDATGEVNSPIRADQFLVPRRREDVGNDLWRTFNRVQEQVIQGGLSAVGRDANNRRRRVTTRTINGIGDDVRLNQALWSLGQRMEQLKTAA